MTNLEKLIHWDKEARKNYTYEYDPIQYRKADDWRSHADEVLSDKSWKDDCDGLGSTVLDLLCRDGYEDSLLYRAMVSSKHNDVIDHFVGIASDGHDLYVVGDTFGPVYKLKEMRHKLLMVSRVSEGITWVHVKDSDFRR